MMGTRGQDRMAGGILIFVGREWVEGMTAVGNCGFGGGCRRGCEGGEGAISLATVGSGVKMIAWDMCNCFSQR